MDKKLMTAFAASATLFAGITASHAAENPFTAQTLEQGYQVAEHHEKGADGKCGSKTKEAKCGAAAATKAGDGKCGAAAASATKAADGKCGTAKSTAKAKDGKCGEGKCGTKK